MGKRRGEHLPAAVSETLAQPEGAAPSDERVSLMADLLGERALAVAYQGDGVRLEHVEVRNGAVGLPGDWAPS